MLKGSNSKLYITYGEYMYVCIYLLKLAVKEVLCSLFLSGGGGSVINNYIFRFLIEIHRNFRVSLTKTRWIQGAAKPLVLAQRDEGASLCTLSCRTTQPGSVQPWQLAEHNQGQKVDLGMNL